MWGITESERKWEYREEKRLWKNRFQEARRLRLTLHLNFWRLIDGREARNQERVPQMNIVKAAEVTVMFTLLFGHTEKVQCPPPSCNAFYRHTQKSFLQWITVGSQEITSILVPQHQSSYFLRTTPRHCL